jgi:hypothetical protein
MIPRNEDELFIYILSYKNNNKIKWQARSKLKMFLARWSKLSLLPALLNAINATLTSRKSNKNKKTRTLKDVDL